MAAMERQTSEIKSYKHECLGMVKCPSHYWRPPSSDEPNPDVENVAIPLYVLQQDAQDAITFQAKKGDLLLGGGGGENAALRISMPEALVFFTREDWEEFFLAEHFLTVPELHEMLYHAYWSPTEAFRFGDGYARLGWDPNDIWVEVWLVEHVLAFLEKEYPDRWIEERGAVPLEEDGSICRLP